MASGGADPGVEVKRGGEPTRIKPSGERGSSPEPIYFLSDRDRSLAMMVTTTIHLYKSSAKLQQQGEEGPVELVSKSLSKVLSPYYPLAGRLGICPQEGKLIVECTDEGVLFMEATADCVMDDVLSRLDQADTLSKLVYNVPRGGSNILEIPLMTTQVTRFKCGGFAVGNAINHCMFDGISQGEFFKDWSRAARGLPLDTTTPFLDRTILNARDPPPPNSLPGFLQVKKKEASKTEPCVYYDDQPMECRSFVVDKDMILRLKSMAMEEEGSVITECSTFDVLTAFVWRARTKAFSVHAQEWLMLIFVTDVRSLLKNPLPKGRFGNAVVPTYAVCPAGDLLGKPFSYGVKLVQEAKRMVNEEYVRSFIENVDPTSMAPLSLATNLIITSWCDLGFHALDFGCGAPIYAGPADFLMRELVMFLPADDNKEDVIIKMNLPQVVMEAFEKLIREI